MRHNYSFLMLLILFGGVFAPPVTQNKSESEKPADQPEDLADVMEYHRYVKEVISALESDPEFRERLEKAKEEDIRSGKIAEDLKFVSHNVRGRLDEIKRTELERLRLLASQKHELENGLNTNEINHVVEHGHLDHENDKTFEVEDLKKLIAKTAQDIEDADKRRREEFKEYEMRKEFEKQQKLKELDEENRKKEEEKLKALEEKHKNHPNLHHPGSKKQLEEVWEEQDHMDKQDFDPRTFFMMHDLDSNGHWDQHEVNSLFLKELDKLYQSGAPEDDMRERAEEMERMREHVFSEADINRDGLISFEEFLLQTKKDDFQKDPGWEGLDQQKVYTEEEFRQFEMQRRREMDDFNRANGMPPQYHPNEIPHGVPQYHSPQPQHPNNGGQHQIPQYQQAQPPSQFQQPNQYNAHEAPLNQQNLQFQQPNHAPQNQQPNHNAQYQQPHQYQQVHHQPDQQKQYQAPVQQQQHEQIHNMNENVVNHKLQPNTSKSDNAGYHHPNVLKTNNSPEIHPAQPDYSKTAVHNNQPSG